MAGHSRPARRRLALIVTAAALCAQGGLLAPAPALGAPGDRAAGQAGQAGQAVDAAARVDGGSVVPEQKRTPVVKRVRGGVTAVVDAGEGVQLNVRRRPSTAARRTAVLPAGVSITIVCQAPGEKIKGTVRTTGLWDRLPTGGYVSDAFVRHSKAPTKCPVPRLPVVAPDPVAPTDPAGPADTVGGTDDATVAQGGTVSPVTPTRTKVSAAGWIAPVPGMVGSGFRGSDRPGHDGVDIAIRKRTPIRSAAAGTVITAVCNASTGNCDVDGSVSVGGCGWYVEVAHAGKVVTRYCHMVRRPLVKVGQRVRAGQVLGHSGSSGNSSGPHLHFEIHTNAPPATSGNAVSPVAFLRARGVKFRAAR